MTETGTLLAANIERVLGAGGMPDECPHGLADLLSSLEQYLALPIPAELRSAAETVLRLSGRGIGADEPTGEFSAALSALQTALTTQLKQDEASSQFADDPEMLQEFLVESRAHLATIEAGLLRLEGEPEDSEALNSVFRSFHTIKGLAGFLGAAAIHELAHETENVLELARSGKLFPAPAIIDLILQAADELSQCLDRAADGNLRALPRCDLTLLDSISGVAQSRSSACPPARKGLDATPRGGIPAESRNPAIVRDDGGLPARTGAESNVVRIETSKLEYLIDMVGELVIAEAVVRHDPAIKSSQDALLSRNLMQLGRVVQEVQKTSMSMRMVAVGTLFRKMNRLVRDLARKSGKEVEMVSFGDDVELDRSIVEDLADPMIHMIRNAVDHGLETEEERTASGKSARGTVRLQATHDAGEIVIEISDDGRGLSAEKILAKARKSGLIAEDSTPDGDSIFKLIFEPGFSTAEKVTDMSGRGVGMDVVRRQIQKLRGRIAIHSTLGQGCTFVLRLPLTLAIIDGLVVGQGNQRFILPMFAVREMFKPESGMIVTLENRAEAAHFRGRLYPIIRLARLVDAASAMEHELTKSVLVVVESRDQLFCIAVDQLIGKQEVVIKSLGRTFRDVPAVSGGAILGDGRVGLIVDVNSLRPGKT